MTRLFTFLDRLYELFVWLAALSLIAMLVAILLQIAGATFGFHIPGLESYAVYCLSASMYLALASTMNRGEHIRVTLLLEKLPERVGLWLDRAAHLLGAGLALWMAWAATRLVGYSWRFNDISLELDATPLWIPQSVLLVGAWVFALAVLDRTLRLFIGGPLARSGDDLQAVE